MGAGGQVLVSRTFNVFDTLPYPVSTMVLTMAGAGKTLKLRLSDRWKMLSWDWFLETSDYSYNDHLIL